MGLSHGHVGPKILAKIKIYILTRAELLCTLCYEIPCISLLTKCVWITIGISTPRFEKLTMPLNLRRFVNLFSKIPLNRHLAHFRKIFDRRADWSQIKIATIMCYLLFPYRQNMVAIIEGNLDSKLILEHVQSIKCSVSDDITYLLTWTILPQANH